MNNNDEQFEQRLSRQPVKELPSAWRAEILAAAHAAQPTPHASRPTSRSWLSTLNSQLSTLLWPHPKAWVGLAAVWVCIGVLNLSTQDRASRVAEKSAPPAPEVVVELQKERKLYAELMGVNEPREAERPKVFSPSPRSGRAEFLVG